MRPTFSKKHSKLTFGPLSLISLSYWGQTKKDRLHFNCKVFFDVSWWRCWTEARRPRLWQMHAARRVRTRSTWWRRSWRVICRRRWLRPRRTEIPISGGRAGGITSRGTATSCSSPRMPWSTLLQVLQRLFRNGRTTGGSSKGC